MDLSALSETLLYGASPDEHIANCVSCEKLLNVVENKLLHQLEDLSLAPPLG